VDRTFRIGLVGTGWVAHQHVAGYRAVLGPRAQVVAACDPRADVLADFADRYGVPGRHADATQMVAEADLDVLVLLTPPEVRDEVLDPAFAAGVHVLVEKPFGQDAVRAAGYVAAAERAGVHLAVGQNFRWFPEHQWMHERLGDPRLGALRSLEARCFQDRPQAPGVWRAEQQRLEMAIFSVHLIDRLQWMAGTAPVAVSAVTRRDERGDLPGEQSTHLLVQFDGGVVASMTSTWMARGLPESTMRADLVGGSVSVHRAGPMSGDASGAVQLHGAEPARVAFPDHDEPPHGPRTYGHGLAALLDAVEGGYEAPHSGRDNLATMGIMDAAYLSASRGGALVEVEEVLG